jgi:hypothetical protein
MKISCYRRKQRVHERTASACRIERLRFRSIAATGPSCKALNATSRAHLSSAVFSAALSRLAFILSNQDLNLISRGYTHNELFCAPAAGRHDVFTPSESKLANHSPRMPGRIRLSYAATVEGTPPIIPKRKPVIFDPEPAAKRTRPNSPVEEGSSPAGTTTSTGSFDFTNQQQEYGIDDNVTPVTTPPATQPSTPADKKKVISKPREKSMSPTIVPNLELGTWSSEPLIIQQC